MRASQVVLMVMNLPAKAGDSRDAGLISGLRRSPGGWTALQSTPVFLSQESHGEWSLVSYSPQSKRVGHD